MNWGYRLLIAYIAGICFLLFFVINSMLQPVDMAAEDYYEKELAFNDQLIGLKNAAALQGGLNIQTTDSQILLNVPPDISKSIKKGEAFFYKPDGSKFDHTYALPISTSGIYYFNKRELSKGAYTVKVSFNNDGKFYYLEQKISL